jgi:hypothetical protein
MAGLFSYMYSIYDGLKGLSHEMDLVAIQRHPF